ncbi:MAG: hypothetical protein E7284_04710 [Lachnospiraceae bacterium]|nr:hypothetical protein [Lachnospiraceae bacterium]
MAVRDDERQDKIERDRIKAERKKLEAEKKQQKKEAKRRAKELAAQEAELDSDSAGSNVGVFFVTLLLVVIWLGITVLLIKLDVCGIGTNIVAPVIKDIPVLNKILPADSITETDDTESYYGYGSLSEAVDQIQYYEGQIDEQLSTIEAQEEQIAALTAEVERLQTFEDNQVEFQRIKTEFYEEVVYSEKGPGVEAFMEYYESMDPETAELIYQQVVTQENYDAEIEEYAQAYSEMKPKEAAGIFEAMTDDLDLAAKILGAMQPDDRGKILGVMDPEVAARITKIMEPES